MTGPEGGPDGPSARRTDPPGARDEAALTGDEGTYADEQTRAERPKGPGGSKMRNLRRIERQVAEQIRRADVQAEAEAGEAAEAGEGVGEAREGA